MHAHAGGLRGRVECFRELVVREVVDEPESQRVELRLGQLSERFVEAFDPALVWLRRRRLAVEPLENPEAGAGLQLDASASNGCRQDVARDREQPRSGGALASSRKRARPSQACANVSAVRSCAASAFLDRPRWKRYTRSA